MAPRDGYSRGRKRKREQREGVEKLGVGATVSLLHKPDQAAGPPDTDGQDDGGLVAESRDNEEGADGWQVVNRSSKRQKKTPNNYPAITHSPNARLQSFVKISDLQGLILYLLADGPGPQWVSVRHKKEVERVVCLLVPGLEADMFNGNISLDGDEDGPTPAANDSGPDDDPAPDVGGSAPSHEPTEAPVPLSPGKPPRKLKMKMNPDDYYPHKLVPEKLPSALEPLVDIFQHVWPIKTPGDYNRMHSPLYAMLNSPLPKSKEDKKFKGPRPPREGGQWQNKRTPVTEYLCPKDEMADNGFSIHPAHLPTQEEKDSETARRHKNCRSKEDGWIDLPELDTLQEAQVDQTDIEEGSVTAGRNVLVVDCEMVTSTTDKFALARVSFIDWSGNTILDELVKPPDPIQDYLTQYSGITKAMLDPVTTTLSDIHAKLRTILTPQTIIAGHSLDSDLKALRISFPFLIDTTLLYPHPKGAPQRSSLKWLSQKYLSREIQHRGPAGHDSLEDARACLDLVKQKCEKGKAWGTSEATAESIFKRLARAGVDDTDAANGSSAKLSSQSAPSKTGAVVDWGDPKRGFGGGAAVAIACENDDDVVQGVRRAVLGSSATATKDQGDGRREETIPAHGCDFVWARLRELEALRGWWSTSKTTDATERLAKTLSSATDIDTDAETLTPAALKASTSRTVDKIRQIYSSLPSKTAFIVYSGSGDPRELRRLSELQAQFKKSYQTLKWDELPVKWTDMEEQALRAAAMKARSGIGFVSVK
ncbi:hypothetical protein MBLNU459_g3044t1 [Dothideomycetes sp. NU459]